VDLLSDREVERVLGGLRLRLRLAGPEVWLRGSYADVDEDGGRDEWTRWSLPGDARVEVRPSLPDRPVVVSPEQPFHLPLRGKARVYVRIPLFAQVVATDTNRTETVLAEFPSIVLSDTWWGTFTEGLAAYWLRTRARRSAPPEIFEPYLAVCPFLLENASDEPLAVDRFAIRTDHLSLFARDGGMWTDEVLVEYHGPLEGSELTYTGAVPREVGDVRRIASPREVPPRGLRARTFGRLKVMTGW
jgi:hypothetical protein